MARLGRASGPERHQFSNRGSGSHKPRPGHCGRSWPAGGQAIGELHVATLPPKGALIVGRWLTALREREKSQTAQTGTDKTDRTAQTEVLSVLSVPVGRVCEKSAPEVTGVSVSFVGAPCGSGHEERPAPRPFNLSPEDWWAFYDERAAIREFDGKTPRTEAETLALQDIATALGACPSHT